ncbi:HR1 rho-binding repeat protein [Cordyceps fumosorosea ARSEF 2679]|uniref:HR1 rho-binding repeat protein n=1 Tax=Cordyceps fumosorosea (strain ARSEF 2679) TaxID=1081104 RepID=A0A167Q3J5_CORFA|nr:HR1 rho-binding repeat protein [Cordyceps fumosorosea ARSEF 2679]OAA57250.1 HR1 rho-binding repeat protein [Cordyceps fumosorosea ARSEF 2679]
MLANSSEVGPRGQTPQQPSNGRTSLDRDGPSGLQPPAAGAHAASMRNLSTSFGPRGSSLNPTAAPGSFSSELRSQILMSSRAGSRLDVGSVYAGGVMDKVLEEAPHDFASEQLLLQLKDRLTREMKIKEGSENMLEALNVKKAKQTKDQRLRVEAELSASNIRIRELRRKISEAQQQHTRPATPTPTWSQDTVVSNGNRSNQSPVKSNADESDIDEAAESPSFALAELLQALEVEGMVPEYYVSRANQLVGLFKRHPAIKYDLVWSIFGMRMQMMLLSESREVVAAGYRVTRYAISDLASLRKIRSLNTDFLVVRSLNNYRKADVEREQALKFVRAFLDVKDGVKEISRAVVRTIAAVAEQGEDRRSTVPAHDQNIDRLRPICIETLAEILVRDAPLLIASGGLGPLSDALSEGSYKASESLASVFLFLLDSPQRRKYLQPSYGLDALFTAFTDPLGTNEIILKQSCRAIAIAMRSWSGIMTLSMYDFRSIRSLIYSMLLPAENLRETVLDLLFSLLRIKPPAWATSFLAGRRLTTYGRVANMKSGDAKERPAPYMEEDGTEQNFVDHYTALILAILIKAGLMHSLLQTAQIEQDPMVKRKISLLLSEVLKLASRLLPPTWSAELQLLPELFKAATDFSTEQHFVATGIVYQISSVSKTLYRSAPSETMASMLPSSDSMIDLAALEEQPRANTTLILDDTAFRQLLIDSGVLNSSNYAKWNWDIIMKIISGPLHTGKRLEEAVRASKWMKRIMSFYRPFKYKFAEIKNTRNTQKYIQAGCALMHALLQSNEGVNILADSKLVRQIAECLAQCDPTSGLTAQYPLFAKDRLTDTLCHGYFAMLGVLTGEPKGIMLLERWKMFNMMYHIVDLKQRPDLIKLLLTNFDYTLQGHHRVLLAKALTAGTKDIRIYATEVLRKCTLRRPVATNALGDVSDSRWAIQLLSTQLYDPEIDVCAAAVKILEKACNRKRYLEYVVECRPALDHLGEIGAPLLLRFLSTSIGYHYLDGLDYISNEMDDWFLGRNDSYVGVVEASLAKAFLLDGDEHGQQSTMFDEPSHGAEFHDNHLPPHFYRELTRTKEGCKLLRDKGHFDEFAATIRDHGMQAEDTELITKVKACMWAVGNVGCMELGAPFLEASDVVEHIVRIAEAHDVMSLRGTAFFVLGLISRSTHGLEILSEYGWDASTTPTGNSLGYCLPTDLSKLLSLQPWQPVVATSIELPVTQRTIRDPPPVWSSTPAKENAEIPPLLTDEQVNSRIVELLVDLGNTVLYKRAAMELQKLKQRKPSAFRSTDFFKYVMGLMEWNHYRLGVRRMVIDFFDKNVMRQIVFEESDDEEDEEDEESEESSEGESEGEDTISKRAQKEEEQRQRFRQANGSEKEEDGGGNSSGNSLNSDDNRTERQRSVSEPTEYLRTSMLPPPLNLGR